MGVLAGLWVFVGTSRGGAGKVCTSTELELVDSVDLRFFCRVGAIVEGGFGSSGSQSFVFI